MLQHVAQKSLSRSFFSINSRGIFIAPQKTWLVHDKANKVSAVIFETVSDQKLEETVPDYSLRSRGEFSQAMLREFQGGGGDYLFFKVNQCVLSPKNTEAGRPFLKEDIYYIGHATMGLCQIHSQGLSFEAESLVSKVPLTNFKGAREIKSMLFTPKLKYEKALDKNSREFFIIFHFGSLKISVGSYRENFNAVKLVGTPYELSGSACGQAVQAVLGVPVDINISPQRAVQKSIFEIITDDVFFQRNLRRAEVESKFSLKATDLGAGYEAQCDSHQQRIK